jgi:hypothetical protein
MDILTCLQGVLMLVIVSTGIDAAQTKVLIPTPMERVSDKEKVYLECRKEMVYPLDMTQLWKAAMDRLSKVTRDAQGDEVKILQGLSDGNFRITNEYFEIDMTYAMAGQLAIRPNARSQAKGYILTGQSTLTDGNFIAKFLTGLDKEKQRVIVVARDDSYKAFKHVQRLCYLAQVEVSVEVFSTDEPIRFGQMSR